MLVYKAVPDSKNQNALPVKDAKRIAETYGSSFQRTGRGVHEENDLKRTEMILTRCQNTAILSDDIVSTSFLNGEVDMKKLFALLLALSLVPALSVQAASLSRKSTISAFSPPPTRWRRTRPALIELSCAAARFTAHGELISMHGPNPRTA